MEHRPGNNLPEGTTTAAPQPQPRAQERFGLIARRRRHHCRSLEGKAKPSLVFVLKGHEQRSKKVNGQMIKYIRVILTMKKITVIYKEESGR